MKEVLIAVTEYTVAVWSSFRLRSLISYVYLIIAFAKVHKVGTANCSTSTDTGTAVNRNASTYTRWNWPIEECAYAIKQIRVRESRSEREETI